jgi:type II secretory pathway pseudopilin PulG
MRIHRPIIRNHGPRGFTLIEASLTTIIVGVAFLAMLQLFATGTKVQATDIQLTSGLSLIKNVHEMALGLAFRSASTPAVWGLDADDDPNSPADWDDINDLAGQTFDPPIDGGGHPIADMDGWKQTIQVRNVDPNGLETLLPNGSSNAVQFTVIVTHGTAEVSRLSWFMFGN